MIVVTLGVAQDYKITLWSPSATPWLCHCTYLRSLFHFSPEKLEKLILKTVNIHFSNPSITFLSKKKCDQTCASE